MRRSAALILVWSAMLGGCRSGARGGLSLVRQPADVVRAAAHDSLIVADLARNAAPSMSSGRTVLSSVNRQAIWPGRSASLVSRSCELAPTPCIVTAST